MFIVYGPVPCDGPTITFNWQGTTACLFKNINN